MIIKTRGIVFKFTKFRETSIITHIYTEETGLGSFIVNSVRSSKSKIKIGYFEPLSLIEITSYYQANREINRISEVRSTYPLHRIRQDIFKSSIIMFLAEILNKCVIEHDKNTPLFCFIYDALVEFDSLQQNHNFHLQFLIQLSAFLGFGIHNVDEFIAQSKNQRLYGSANYREVLSQLITPNFNASIKINNEQRSVILSDLIFYYQQHIGIIQLKSLAVLNSIFN